MKRTASLSLIALACATTFAITQVEAQESQASASAGQLDKFVGSGTCTGNVMAMGKNPGHATTGKYTGEKVLDGNWVVIHYDEDQSAVNPKPFHVIQYFGYDTAKKRYVSVLVDNAEASYSTGTSPGWKGDSITFDESMSGGPVSFRDTFTNNGSGMSSHMGTMRDNHGKWIKTDEENCKSS